MSIERSLGLTGLEQYSVERAGYFVRRAALNEEQLSVATSLATSLQEGDEAALLSEIAVPEPAAALLISPLLNVLSSDLLRFPQLRSIRRLPARSRGAGEWERRVPIDPSLTSAAQAALLHRYAESFAFVFALQKDASIVVLPGSHEGRGTEDQQRHIDQHPDSVPGAIRLKLEPGDLLVISSAVLRRLEPLPERCGDLLELCYERRSV